MGHYGIEENLGIFCFGTPEIQGTPGEIRRIVHFLENQ